MECDPTRVCELLVGLGDVEVLGVDDEAGGPLRVHIRGRAPRPACERCGGPLWSDGERSVELVDLPAFGRPARLVWHKRRWRCPDRGCGAGTVTEQDREIAPPREKLTTRAGRWTTRQGGRGRPLGEVADELGCSWHPVNASVRRWGEALLEADTERIAQTEALGLDEHLMWRRGRFRTKAWATGIVDVGRGQLLDIVAGRTAQAPTRWLLARPPSWLAGVRWAVLDLSGPYRSAFDTALPEAEQVADPFHVVRLGNDALDEVRRRVQNQTLGHRGRKHDPLYRARKLLVSASERITDSGRTRLRGLLDAGDPYGEVRDAWHAKETLRSVYDIDDAKVGAATVAQLAADLQDPGLPPEINRLGRTIWRWRHQIANWHAARVTNAATEAANNLIKRVKRAAFGFTNFANYRIRALLYAGKPNWALLDTLTPTIYVGNVSYVDYETTFIPENPVFLPYFHKRQEFRHEQEVRAISHELLNQNESGGLGTRQRSVGEYYEVDLSTLIQQIVVAPYAPDWFIELVSSVANRYGLGDRVRRSSLSTNPTWSR